MLLSRLKHKLSILGLSVILGIFSRDSREIHERNYCSLSTRLSLVLAFATSDSRVLYVPGIVILRKVKKIFFQKVFYLKILNDEIVGKTKNDVPTEYIIFQ